MTVTVTNGKEQRPVTPDDLAAVARRFEDRIRELDRRRLESRRQQLRAELNEVERGLGYGETGSRPTTGQLWDRWRDAGRKMVEGR